MKTIMLLTGVFLFLTSAYFLLRAYAYRKWGDEIREGWKRSYPRT
jgi:hypothetical protein